MEQVNDAAEMLPPVQLAVTQPGMEAAHPYYSECLGAAILGLKLTEAVPLGMEGNFVLL